MSQWWRLPPELGGGIGEEKDREDDWVWLYIPGRPFRIKIKQMELTKSPPPCPPEPDRSLTLIDRDGRAWQSLDIGTWKCVDGGIRKWQDLWEKKGPISVLGPPTPLVIEQTEPEPGEYWTPGPPGRPIKWAKLTGTYYFDPAWTGYTVGNLARVQVSRSYALGARTEANRRVNIRINDEDMFDQRYDDSLSNRSSFLSFTTDVARDLAEALMNASGDD